METLKERLKNYYGWDEESFGEFTAEPSSLSFPSLSGQKEPEKALARLKLALVRKDKVLLYGDYDTGGILATSIFHRSLSKFGLEANYFIPSRYQDGYGLNMANAKRIALSGYSLLILIDNGVSCLEEVSYLKEKGIDVLIFDHHELPKELPPALALVHPFPLGIGKTGGFNISAGFLCYLFSLLLSQEEDSYLRTLAGITTLSDMMPMEGINRSLVALTLRDLRSHPYPEIVSLCQKRRIDEKVLAMEVIPSINALGRMEEGHKTSLAVAYFSLRDPKNREKISSWMKETNERRKELTKEASSLVKFQQGSSGIVANLPLKEGLNGLLANRLMKQYGVPVAIFSSSYSDPNVLVGSLRSEEGFDVLDCLRELSPYCLKSGGHAHAGGIEILSSDFPSFYKAYLSYCRAHPFIKAERRAIPLLLSEANMESFRTIRLFGPFGEDHEEPLFVLSNLSVDSFQYSKDGKYLMTPLGYKTRLVSFSLGRKDFLLKDKVSFFVRFQLNEFRGEMGLELRVEEASSK